MIPHYENKSKAKYLRNETSCHFEKIPYENRFKKRIAGSEMFGVV